MGIDLVEQVDPPSVGAPAEVAEDTTLNDVLEFGPVLWVESGGLMEADLGVVGLAEHTIEHNDVEVEGCGRAGRPNGCARGWSGEAGTPPSVGSASRGSCGLGLVLVGLGSWAASVPTGGLPIRMTADRSRALGAVPSGDVSLMPRDPTFVDVTFGPPDIFGDDGMVWREPADRVLEAAPVELIQPITLEAAQK